MFARVRRVRSEYCKIRALFDSVVIDPDDNPFFLFYLLLEGICPRFYLPLYIPLFYRLYGPAQIIDLFNKPLISCAIFRVSDSI